MKNTPLPNTPVLETLQQKREKDKKIDKMQEGKITLLEVTAKLKTKHQS